jgi:hypothetical protein
MKHIPAEENSDLVAIALSLQFAVQQQPHVDLLERCITAKCGEDTYTIQELESGGYLASADNLLEYIEQETKTSAEAVSCIQEWYDAAKAAD